eukprot:CAMPEP_0184200938 /NCGR_PEP_ID=MMETSP0976-20121227/7786_1 /TAXON_ID=483370 /ORGANISM="non described non described, Strain CCMP2097" /LENGTH=59 /DNA_ID=CAMNT_0026505455 /DNA_START=70 /DNA_END=245 /DNA_ORIENTATION=+
MAGSQDGPEDPPRSEEDPPRSEEDGSFESSSTTTDEGTDDADVDAAAEAVKQLSIKEAG